MPAPITKSLPEFLLERVKPQDDGCWIWQKSVGTHGYGVANMARDGRGIVCAHVLSYEAFKGSVPPKKLVLHTCHVRKCCNPEHLYAGTRADNTRDMMQAGRHRNQHGRTSCQA